MDVNEHEGILAIFLSEAEGIVHSLFAQLEELQYGYDGQRILDDIHRGFHTLYGGSAVLQLEELAECAQLAERVLDRLRMRRISLSPSLVSLIIGATSAIEAMLSRLIEHQTVRPIPEELKTRLLRAAGQERESVAPPRPPVVDGDPLSHFFSPSQPPSEQRLKPAGATFGKGALEQLLTGYAATSLAAKTASPSASAARVNDAVAVRERDGEPATDAAHISDLIRELAWVRNRLMGFKREEGGDKLNKSLAYLDLVTRDMEQWLERNRL